jgi:hypothetical protein
VRALAGASNRQPAAIFIVAALSLLSIGVLGGHGVGLLAPSLAVGTVVALGHRWLLKWDNLIALVVIVVLFVPIDRYGLPASLPFDLELYRVVVAAILLLWLSSLLIDSGVQLRRTPFDRPLVLIVACILASDVTNPSRVTQYGSYVVKSLLFFLSFLLFYYLTATVLRHRESCVLFLKLLTIGGALIGLLAVYEQRFYYNVFDHLHTVLPFLTFQGRPGYSELGGNLRAFGSSQHPIAFGAAMIMIVPLAVYLARTCGRRWWVAAILLLLGAFASGSRTALIMLGIVGIVFLCLKPIETKRLWPVLVPAVIVVHFALPGTIGGFKAAFFPEGGLIAQQSRIGAGQDPLLAGGRIRQLRPMLAEASEKPLFGEGFGTRLSGQNTSNRNAPILDNQWLNNVLEIGFVGLAAWVWLFVTSSRLLIRASRTARSVEDSWLFAALAASIMSFAVGMLTYDAFGYTQVTFIFWIVLGISVALLRISGGWPLARVPSVPGRRVLRM